MAPTILTGIIRFLNDMDSSEYLVVLVDLLIFFSVDYQQLFGQRFEVHLQNGN